MIQLSNKIWIGDSDDGAKADLKKACIATVVNCAADLYPAPRFLEIRLPVVIQGGAVVVSEAPEGPKVEYAQLGLVDGPGNTISEYHAVLLKVCGAVQAKRGVLLYDHDGSRAAVVGMMVMHAVYRKGWDHWLGVVRDKTKKPGFEPHTEHRRAFNRINWRLVSTVMGE